jgi:hypothetical protein
LVPESTYVRGTPLLVAAMLLPDAASAAGAMRPLAHYTHRRWSEEKRGCELLQYVQDGPSELAGQRLRSGSVGAAPFRFRVRSLRSSHQSGIGWLADGRMVKATDSPRSPADLPLPGANLNTTVKPLHRECAFERRTTCLQEIALTCPVAESLYRREQNAIARRECPSRMT